MHKNAPLGQKQTLAEIESYLQKSARAVGLDWGLAQEAGKAARWLAAFNLPGAELMLHHLQTLEGADYSDYKPHINSPIWQAEGSLMCPIMSGAAIADRAKQILEGKIIQLSDVAYPLILVATIGQACRFYNITITTTWADIAFSCYAHGIRIKGNRDHLSLARVDSVICQQTLDSTPEQLPATKAYYIEADIWSNIQQLAHRTYAPATEASRAGAGAGLTDND